MSTVVVLVVTSREDIGMMERISQVYFDFRYKSLLTLLLVFPNWDVFDCWNYDKEIEKYKFLSGETCYYYAAKMQDLRTFILIGNSDTTTTLEILAFDFCEKDRLRTSEYLIIHDKNDTNLSELDLHLANDKIYDKICDAVFFEPFSVMMGWDTARRVIPFYREPQGSLFEKSVTDAHTVFLKTLIEQEGQIVQVRKGTSNREAVFAVLLWRLFNGDKRVRVVLKMLPLFTLSFWPLAFVHLTCGSSVVDVWNSGHFLLFLCSCMKWKMLARICCYLMLFWATISSCPFLATGLLYILVFKRNFLMLTYENLIVATGSFQNHLVWRLLFIFSFLVSNFLSISTLNVLLGFS